MRHDDRPDRNFPGLAFALLGNLADSRYRGGNHIVMSEFLNPQLHCDNPRFKVRKPIHINVLNHLAARTMNPVLGVAANRYPSAVATALREADRDDAVLQARAEVHASSGHEAATERHPARRVMIPARHHHADTQAHEFFKCVFKHRDRSFRRDRAVIHITGNQDRIDRVLTGGIDHITQRLTLSRFEGLTVEITAQMPVRCVQELHGFTLPSTPEILMTNTARLEA